MVTELPSDPGRPDSSRPDEVTNVDISQMVGRNVRLDPSPIFDVQMSLSFVADGYAVMDDGTALKVLLRP